MIEATDIQVNKVRRDGGTQPRGELNQEHIADLVEALQTGENLEPILVFYDGTNHWLVDGFHRIEAHIKTNKQKINAKIQAGTLEDAQWHSYSVNQHLSLKRTHADKQRAVIGALKHPQGVNKSNVAIGKHCGVSMFMVWKWRERLEQDGEIAKIQDREVVRGNSVYKQKVRPTATIPSEERFKVVSPSIPEYYGQVVILKSVKSGDCYECLTPDGQTYPFIKDELGGVNDPLPNGEAKVEPSLEVKTDIRQRIIEKILQIPEDKLPDIERAISNF